MIKYFQDKISKSKKKNKKYKMMTTILKSCDTFAIIATKSSSITLSLTGIGLLFMPILTATACGLPIGNKINYEVIMHKYNKYKKQYEKDQQTIKSFDKLYRKSLQDKVFVRNEYEPFCTYFTKNVDETKTESF